MEAYTPRIVSFIAGEHAGDKGNAVALDQVYEQVYVYVPDTKFFHNDLYATETVFAPEFLDGSPEWEPLEASQEQLRQAMLNISPWDKRFDIGREAVVNDVKQLSQRGRVITVAEAGIVSHESLPRVLSNPYLGELLKYRAQWGQWTELYRYEDRSDAARAERALAKSSHMQKILADMDGSLATRVVQDDRGHYVVLVFVEGVGAEKPTKEPNP